MKILVNHLELASHVSGDLLPGWGITPENVSAFITEVESVVFASPTEDLISLYSRLKQVEACFKKETPADGTVPEELRMSALKQHLELEEQNRFYNNKTFAGNKHNQAKAIIENILPPLEWVWDEMWELCDFGPGAVFTGGGHEGRHVMSKIGGKHSCTRAAAGLYLDVVKTYFPNLAERQVGEDTLEIVRGNRLAFVPKDRTKCRTIAIEPSCNVFLQKGIGEWMARRLRKFGINLFDQEPNFLAAWEGSITGDLATIDLSNASSTISRGVVRSLLPADWFALLDVVRSPCWQDDSGEWHPYEMFSSQGNAFTFPLETIIFYALSYASYSGSLIKPIVYGDDIVIPTKAYADVTATLEEYGFTVNDKKSFSTGFFRESCGGDFIDGTNVRPIFYKKGCVKYSDVATLHNLLQERWGDELHNTLLWLRSLVPNRIEGPVMVVVSKDSTPWNRLSRNDGWFMVKGFSPKATWDRDWQCFTYYQKYYGVRSAPNRLKTFPYEGGDELSWKGSWDSAAYLAFLRGGSTSVDLSLNSRYYIGKRKLPMHVLRSESSLMWS